MSLESRINYLRLLQQRYAAVFSTTTPPSTGDARELTRQYWELLQQ